MFDRLLGAAFTIGRDERGEYVAFFCDSPVALCDRPQDNRPERTLVVLRAENLDGDSLCLGDILGPSIDAATTARDDEGRPVLLENSPYCGHDLFSIFPSSRSNDANAHLR